MRMRCGFDGFMLWPDFSIQRYHMVPTSRSPQVTKKGTGHHFGGNSLICLMGDFNSWRVVQPVGMP